MNRIALINPGKNKMFGLQEPISLAIIAGYLEKNKVDVTIIDELAGDNIKKELSRFQPDIVGITSTTPLAGEAYAISEFCRTKGIKTVMGGTHANALPQEVIKHVDAVVLGEGEYPMLEIAKNGITSKIIQGSYVKDLDSLPFPAYPLLNMNHYMGTKDRIQENYLQFVGLHQKVASVITSRGCPYDCTFCHNSWKGIPFRFHSAEYVINLIKYLIKDFGVNVIWFFDDNLFANKPRLKKICGLMKENRIRVPWAGNARVDNVDINSLQMVKDAGCRQITFGFESGSQKILNILNKQTTVEQNSQAIKLCNQVGLLANGTFMIGNPTETIADVRMTQDFIKSHNIGGCGVLITTPYPKTKLWEWCKDHGKIPSHFKWSSYNYQDIPINVSDINPKILKKLYYETAYISLPKGPTKLSTLVKEAISHPIKHTRSIFINPSRIPNILKRLRL